MLKYYIKTTEALKRLRTDKDGVVSFEYVIVACLYHRRSGCLRSENRASQHGAVERAYRDRHGSHHAIARLNPQRGHWDVPMPHLF